MELTKFLDRSLATFIREDGERRALVRALMEDAPESVRDSADPIIHAWYIQAIARLISGEPVQYITGKAPFMGMMLKVTPTVLIPRPETEELVDLALRALKKGRESPAVLDLGTGSGCIAIALKRALPKARVIAWDISEEAIEVARENAMHQGLEIEWQLLDALEESVWSDLPPLDLLISNPPYIDASEQVHMPAQVLEHEPHLALFPPGEDPLVFYRLLARKAPEVLKPGGLLLCECSSFRARAIESLFRDPSWEEIALFQDMSGHERMLRARIPSASA